MGMSVCGYMGVVCAAAHARVRMARKQPHIIQCDTRISLCHRTRGLVDATAGPLDGAGGGRLTVCVFVCVTARSMTIF